jgi:hypothetical protein
VAQSALVDLKALDFLEVRSHLKYLQIHSCLRFLNFHLSLNFHSFLRYH